MTERTITCHICESTYDSLPECDKTLINHAINASKQAYAPYSHFHVGAAARLKDGQIVTGNNQENVAYPSGLCAERVALFSAHAQHPHTPITTLAIAAYNERDNNFLIASPCGACRQIMVEFQRQTGTPITLLLYSPEKVFIVKDAKELLPLAFDF